MKISLGFEEKYFSAVFLNFMKTEGYLLEVRRYSALMFLTENSSFDDTASVDRFTK